MTTITRHPPLVRAPQRAATALSALTLLAATVRLVLPPGSAPSLLGLPAWCAVAAAALGLAASLAVRALPARAAVAASLAATAALLVVAADGLAFDVVGLLMSAITAVSGTAGPVAMAMDWPGFATRALALGSAALIGTGALRSLRQVRGQRSGSPAVARWASAARWAAYPAAVLALGYGALKAAWGLGSDIGLADPELFGEVSFWSPGLGDTAVLAAIGVALALWLARGRARGLTRWPPIAGALLGAAMLIPVGLLGSYGLFTGAVAAFDGELEPWVGLGIYPWFLAWGLTLAVAAWSFWYRTRERS
jgi:hypothetical protein